MMTKTIKYNREQFLYSLLLLLNTSDLFFKLGIRLLEMFPDPAELFAKNTDLERLGLPAAEILKLKSPNHRAAEKDLFWLSIDRHHIVTIYDDEYPALLKEIPSPPLLLFVEGDLELLKMDQIAMVGSRNPTPIGSEIATNFARELVTEGVVITSGLAIGIDAASHRGAMEGAGKTVAVMGTGLNHIYPSRQKQLAQEIVDSGGALVSEFPLDEKARAWHFPLRNRIISGLSIGTLVVEAALRSGSLITARVAGEQGREVFAIPGSIYSSVSRGCHHLILQGAKLVEKPSDILEEFPCFFPKDSAKNQKVIDNYIKNKLDREHGKLLDCMGFEVTGVDLLAKRSGLSVSQVSILLLELELQGLIKTVLGGYSRAY